MFFFIVSVFPAHLFKILFRELTSHTDLRQELGECKEDSFQSFIEKLNNRLNDTTNENNKKLSNESSESIPYWYKRHLTHMGNLNTPVRDAYTQRLNKQQPAADDTHQFNNDNNNSIINNTTTEEPETDYCLAELLCS